MLTIKLYHSQFEELIVDENKPISVSLRELGKDPRGDCGGGGSCGKCKARLVSGKLSNLTAKEEACLTETELAAGWFLMCQRKPVEDLIIEMPLRDLPCYSFNHRPLPKDWVLDGVMQKQVIKLADLQGEEDYASQLLKLAAKFGVENISPVALRQFSQVLSGGEANLTIAFADQTIWAVEAGITSGEQYALAVDFGSATIAVALIDVAGKEIIGNGVCGSGQRAFGGDMATRLQAAAAEADGALVMQDVAIMNLNQLLFELCQRLGVSNKRIYDFVLAGNIVGSHFFFGVNPRLGQNKLTPIFTELKPFRAEEIGLNIYRQARVRVLPCLSQTLGGDARAALLAAKLSTEPALLLDLGVETSMLLQTAKGLKTRVVNTPLLDGLDCQMGMTASDGAIVDLAFDEAKQDIVATWLGDFEVKGICGAGLIKVIRVLQSLGVITKEGQFAHPKALPDNLAKRLRDSQLGQEFVLAGYGLRVAVITQTDVTKVLDLCADFNRELESFCADNQLKTADIRQVVITGPYGNNLDVASAMEVGFLPAFDLEKIVVEPDLVLQGVIEALA